MGEFFALMSAFAFSMSNLFIKKGTTRSSKNNGAFISILITAVLSTIIVIGMTIYNGLPNLTEEGMAWFIFAGVLTSLMGRTFLYSSIQHLGSVRATAVKRLNPFFAVILGVLILGEPLTGSLIIGMGLIFFSFTMLIMETYGYKGRLSKKEISASEEKVETKDLVGKKTIKTKIRSLLEATANIGYVYGPLSALCYAFGYLVRKEGLNEIPDPLIGSMIGGWVGVCIILLLALFQKRYQVIVKTTFTEFHSWLFFAGIFTSAGQIFYFAALNLTQVSKVALIASIEVIITMLLSVWMIKTGEKLTRTVIIAALMSMAGASIIAFG